MPLFFPAWGYGGGGYPRGLDRVFGFAESGTSGTSGTVAGHPAEKKTPVLRQHRHHTISDRPGEARQIGGASLLLSALDAQEVQTAIDSPQE